MRSYKKGKFMLEVRKLKQKAFIETGLVEKEEDITVSVMVDNYKNKVSLFVYGTFTGGTAHEVLKYEYYPIEQRIDCIGMFSSVQKVQDIIKESLDRHLHIIFDYTVLRCPRIGGKKFNYFLQILEERHGIKDVLKEDSYEIMEELKSIILIKDVFAYNMYLEQMYHLKRKSSYKLEKDIEITEDSIPAYSLKTDLENMGDYLFSQYILMFGNSHIADNLPVTFIYKEGSNYQEG